MGKKRFSAIDVVRRWARVRRRRAALWMWRKMFALFVRLPFRTSRRLVRLGWKPLTTAACFTFAGATFSHYYAPAYLAYERSALWKVAEAHATVIETVATYGGYELPKISTPLVVLPGLTITDKMEREALRVGLSGVFGRSLGKVENPKQDPKIRSGKGAIGIMQIMPDTGRAICGMSVAQLEEVDSNIACGFRYLKLLYDQYEGDVEKVMLHYNGGKDAIRIVGKCGDNIKCMGGFEESYRYVRKIINFMASDMRA